MEHHHDKKGSGGGINGFLLGVIVGVVVTLLFTTKKGRHIIKTLTDEGMNKFSELEELMQDMKEYDEEEEGEVDPEEVPSYEEQNGENPPESPKKYVAKKSPLRRFFRGIPKRN